MRVFVEKNVKKELVEENSYFSFLHACERGIVCLMQFFFL